MKHTGIRLFTLMLAALMLVMPVNITAAFAAGEPQPPTKVTAEAGKISGQVTLTITEPTELGVTEASITSYKIDIYASSNYHGTVTPQYTGTTTTHSIGSLPNDTEFTFKVYTVTNQADNNVSTTSTDVKATPSEPAPSQTVPGAPGLSVTPGNSSLNVKLTPPSDKGNAGSLTYTIKVIRNGITVYSALSSHTEFDVTGLINGTSYTVEAYATNSAGDSAKVSKIAAPTASAQTAPGTPGVTLTTGNGYIDVNITKPAIIGNGASYLTYYITVKQGSNTHVYTTTSTGAYRIAGLTNGVSCTVEVYALSDIGLTGAVVTKTATPGTSTTYNVVSQSGTYTGSGTAYLIIDAPHNTFSSLKLNGGTLVNGSHYAVEADGSRTRVTLYASCLSELTNGKHTVTATFTGGTCNATINVSKSTIITPTPAPSGKGNFIVTANKLNVRSAAGTNSSIIGWLTKNTMVTVEQTMGNWGKIIMTNGRSGWVSMSYLKSYTGTVAPPAAIGSYTTTGNVHMRLGPGTAYRSVGVLKRGVKVNVISFSGNWAYATVGNMNVYISRTYLK